MAKSVKRFERYSGPDIALYKNYLYLLPLFDDDVYLTCVRACVRACVCQACAQVHLHLHLIAP